MVAEGYIVFPHNLRGAQRIAFHVHRTQIIQLIIPTYFKN